MDYPVQQNKIPATPQLGVPGDMKWELDPNYRWFWQHLFSTGGNPWSREFSAGTESSGRGASGLDYQRFRPGIPARSTVFNPPNSLFGQ